MALVLDAGALIGIDRRDRSMRARLEVAQRHQIPVRTSSIVVAQVWRDGRRQALLASVLKGVAAAPVEPLDGRSIGELLGKAELSDVVDAHLALLVSPGGDTVLTSDPDDLAHLLAVRQVKAAVVAV